MKSVWGVSIRQRLYFLEWSDALPELIYAYLRNSEGQRNEGSLADAVYNFRHEN
jgi:hypothetical protein